MKIDGDHLKKELLKQPFPDRNNFPLILRKLKNKKTESLLLAILYLLLLIMSF